MKAQYRFIVDQETLEVNQELELAENISHKILKVLRLNIADQLELGCKNKSYLSTITKILNNKVIVRIETEYNTTPSKQQTNCLYFALCKGDKNDFICQKATEIGVNMICFVSCHRSIAKIETKKITEKLSRWKKICTAAAQQSKQNIVPEVSYQQDISNIFANKSETYFFADSSGENILTLPIDRNLKNNLIIGPEGGFTDEEKTFFKSNSQAIALSSNILRSETAAILGLAVLNLRFSL